MSTIPQGDPNTVEKGGVGPAEPARPNPRATDPARRTTGRELELTVLVVFVGALVVALVALSVAPATAVSTAFAAGLAGIELRRRADRR